LISQSEAFTLLSRWQVNKTDLRVSAQLPEIHFDLMALIDRVDWPLVGLDLAYRGHVELRFDPSWGYEFGTPDLIPSEERSGESPSGSRRYEFGENVIAIGPDRSRVFFMEIVKPLE
jgi:hypothetical protein